MLSVSTFYLYSSGILTLQGFSTPCSNAKHVHCNFKHAYLVRCKYVVILYEDFKATFIKIAICQYLIKPFTSLVYSAFSIWLNKT